MRAFNYSLLKNLKWDSEIVSYPAAIHEPKGRQELYLKQQSEKFNKLVEILNVQSIMAQDLNKRFYKKLPQKVLSSKYKISI